MFSSPSFLEFPPPLSSPFSSNNESPVNQNKIVDDFVSSLLAREELEKYSSSGSSPMLSSLIAPLLRLAPHPLLLLHFFLFLGGFFSAQA
ncbi:Hypothetical protein FKW44_004733 [Caligus rogercresseyi]|uniref:Uncharacterized protein n=1 Tax=Caligus rogercresseyi TaxID=217165 RepID=A0A7T8HMA1_CALRO|nr:Hypothetical protein FKW44_004733 [Caligus rogercresseyi]